jgi:hypothetical protein
VNNCNGVRHETHLLQTIIFFLSFFCRLQQKTNQHEELFWPTAKEKEKKTIFDNLRSPSDKNFVISQLRFTSRNLSAGQISCHFLLSAFKPFVNILLPEAKLFDLFFNKKKEKTNHPPLLHFDSRQIRVTRLPTPRKT